MQFKAMQSAMYKLTAAALAIIAVIYLWLRSNFKLLSHRHISGVSFSFFHKANITRNCRLNPSSSTMDDILEAIILREQGQFHKSKMTLWNFLQNNTTNGYKNFCLGKMASIPQIFDALSQGMLNKEKDALFMKHSLTIQFSKSAHHQHSRTTTNSLYFLHNSCINIMDISNSAYDPVNVVEKHLNRKHSISQQLCIQKDENGTNICNGNLLYTSKLLNAPFFLPVELDKDENRPVQQNFQQNWTSTLEIKLLMS